MRNRHKVRIQDQIMRLLTLVCFFYFSGLNNGFTYFVVSSGQVQRIDFAPVVIEQCLAVLNPVNWKKLVFEPLHNRIFNRSTRMIEHVSQNVVESILIESSLFQIWVKDSLFKVVSTSNNKAFREIRLGVPSGETTIIQEDLLSPSHDSVIRIDREISASSLNKVRTIGESDRHFGMRDPPGYLKTDQKKSWLMDRYRLWNGNKSRSNLLSGFFVPGAINFAQDQRSASVSQAKVRRFVRYVPERFRVRLLHTLERGEDDGETLLNEKVQEERSRYHKDSGILFGGAHLPGLGEGVEI